MTKQAAFLQKRTLICQKEIRKNIAKLFICPLKIRSQSLNPFNDWQIKCSCTIAIQHCHAHNFFVSRCFPMLNCGIQHTTVRQALHTDNSVVHP